VGFQLPWSLDGVQGGGAAINCMMSDVAVARGGRFNRQCSVWVMQGEELFIVPIDGVSVVTQGTTLSENHQSRKFAAAVQGPCQGL